MLFYLFNVLITKKRWHKRSSMWHFYDILRRLLRFCPSVAHTAEGQWILVKL